MSYPSAARALGPVAGWRLDETSGTTVRDHVGIEDLTANAGVTRGTPALVRGGLSSRFVAASSGAATSSTFALEPKLGQSIVAWVNPDSLPASNISIFCLHVDANNALYFRLFNSGSDLGLLATWLVAGTFYRGAAVFAPNLVEPIGRTYMLAATLSLAGDPALYVNRSEVAITTTPGSAVGSAGLHIGSDGGSNRFDGRIDEVWLYDKELTAAQVARLHVDGVAKGPPIATMPLLGRFRHIPRF